MPPTLPAGWKPIDSAPKDFVTEFDGWNGERVPNVTWAHPEYAPKGEYAWCRSVYEHQHGWSMERINGLTHWMPLPEPPCQICNDQGAVGNILTAEPCPNCSTPPASAQPERDWELTCDGCDGDGFVYVERRVGPCATDIQTFKEDCDCCEGRGFVFAFQDIPGIDEYVKSCRAASAQDDTLARTGNTAKEQEMYAAGIDVGRAIERANAAVAGGAQDDAKDERQAFEAWAVRILGDNPTWHESGHCELAWQAWQARAGAPAAGDARDAERYRIVRKSIADEANGANQVAAASEAIGLARGSYPTEDQFDAIVDHIAAQQGKGGEA